MSTTPTQEDGAGGAAQDNQFVTFAVADEMFAVPMAPVQEIIRVPEVARLPLAPAALDGLANLRGRVLPILNLRRMFGTRERESDDATRALVIQLGTPLGFVVDRVASVISVDPGAVEPVRAIQSVVQTDYLTGVINRPAADGGRELLLVLDFQRMVDEQFGPSAARGSTNGTEASADVAEAPDGGAVTDELRLVSFTVCGQEYAIDIADVQEIVQVPAGITAVPNTPHHVLGLISLRQRLLPLVSLRSLFGLAAQELDEHHRIVVVALPGGGQVGLVTDTVKEVLSVPRTQADAMPGVLARDSALQEFERICRLDDGKRLVSIIATDRLLGLQAIQDAADFARGEHSERETTMDETTSRSDDDVQVVIFRLGAEEFGVPIMSVQEIVRVPEALTRVPKTPAFVEGVINLRGTVLPVIDQRTRLGMATLERNDRQRIMVYTLGAQRTGFIVDSVAEVLRIGRQAIAPAPRLSDEQGRLITQVARLDGDKRLVMLIDPEQLLGRAESAAVGRMLDSDPAPLPKAA
ncbi:MULTISPECIES: chemotaxis protein CheW [Rubrivivax]|nr:MULTISPECIES: chemotaxis protein CheW [Rubrivivax]EGJ09338.1 CheW protein [Rubrivivax benzoatilyticus JA2 = ATCC BAA-35]MCC9597543.1 chemotaxis protein CheW [Rubrivivax sp. JA1055]MCC9646199.1 chemotaxis protein CheW [Rubrivivax sp. JA1029]